MSKNKAENKSVSQELLESCRAGLYKVKDTFEIITNDPSFDALDIESKLKIADTINKIIGGLGKSIETLAILEAKVEKEEIQKSSRRGQVKTSLFEE